MPADIKDYLEASADASKRTITIVIVMVVASVVVFTGLLNSSQSQWMGLRMRGLADVRSHYTQSSLGHYPERQNFRNDQEFNDAKRMFESRYLELSEGVVKAYLDTLSIHVPFFGFSFDMNDLGLLGGIGLVVILTCYQFFLSRELNNLQMSFEEARKLGMDHFAEFYKLLAMRQVFTIPMTKYIRRSKFLVVTPKLLTWLPLIIYLGVVVSDVRTTAVTVTLLTFRVRLLFMSEFLALIFMSILCSHITIRLIRMDRLWADYWGDLDAYEKRLAATVRTSLSG
jgi:uncharacterized membrane protein